MTEEMNDPRNSATGSSETPQSTKVVNADGYICDSLTGEVLGHVDTKEQFVPDTLVDDLG